MLGMLGSSCWQVPAGLRGKIQRLRICECRKKIISAAGTFNCVCLKISRHHLVNDHVSQGLNGDKLNLSDVELGTMSGVCSQYFPVELVTALCISKSKLWVIQSPYLTSLVWLKAAVGT